MFNFAAVSQAVSQAAAHVVADVNMIEAAAKTDTTNTVQKYYFVHRNTILGLPPGSRLPAYRDLADQGLLHGLDFDLFAALNGEYRKTFAVLSHRWVLPGEPDPHGEQLEDLQDVLKGDPQIEYIWIDSSCMPQNTPGQPRSPEEDQYFGEALQSVNMLYLTMEVIVLYDPDYATRFWCLLESILAFSHPERSGIVRIRHAAEKHSTVLERGQSFYSAFKEEWGTLPYQQQIEALSSDEVKVTNKGDKAKQIERLANLNGRIQALFAAGQIRF